MVYHTKCMIFLVIEQIGMKTISTLVDCSYFYSVRFFWGVKWGTYTCPNNNWK